MATFPLKAYGETLGVFALYSHVPDYFNDFHLNLLQTLAEQIAIAMHANDDRSRLQLQDIALTAAANAIVLTDRDGTIIWANPSFTALTGYSLITVIGENPRILRSGYQDTAFYQEMWATITAGQTWQGELINRRADGSFYYEEMTITPVYAQDAAITHFIAVKQDVSKRKQDEEALWLEKERAQVILLFRHYLV